MMETPTKKAARTAKWATTMTKWLVTRTKSRTDWQLVEFPGPGGAESRGIVDMLAIRKDHRSPPSGPKRGDLFEIVLVQIKGGTARSPSRDDILRLRKVARQLPRQGDRACFLEEGEPANALRPIKTPSS